MPEDPISDEAKKTADAMKKLLAEGWQTVSLLMVRRLPPTEKSPEGELQLQVFNTAPHPFGLALEGARLIIGHVIQGLAAQEEEAADAETVKDLTAKSKIHLM